MSRLLLDTHTVIWWDSGSRALGTQATKAIRNASEVYVSAVSEWELAIKAGLGKVKLKRSIQEASVEAGFDQLAISFEHAEIVRTLMAVHKDPFDRLLVGAAMVEGLTLVSADSVMANYPINVIEARR